MKELKGLKGFISWNGFNYAYRQLKSGNKFYKSKTVRFDDSMGGTQEVSAEEYFECAEKYARVMGRKL